MKRNMFILKCFIQFTCTNLYVCQKEWVTFNLLQKERGTQKGVVPSERKRGRFQTWRKLWF